MAEHFMRDIPMAEMVPPPVVPANPPHPLDALLPEICQLLDTCREDFMQRGIWTEWDQSVRDRITAYNLSKRANVLGDPRHSLRTAGVPEVAAPLTPEAADRLMPSYGEVPWADLEAAITAATGAPKVFSDEFHIGHQEAPINMNSLNRIVSMFIRRTHGVEVPAGGQQHE